jgi:hypothetical protein
MMALTAASPRAPARSRRSIVREGVVRQRLSPELNGQDLTARLTVAQRPFDHAALGDHEIDLAAIGVAEVTRLDVSTPGVLLPVNPLEQVGGDQVLEAGGLTGTREEWNRDRGSWS